MIQVRCEGCQASFELDEKRLPKTGMRVRCPKCGSSFHVTPEGTTSALQPPAAKPPMPKPPMPRPPGSAPIAGDADLPAPVSAKSDLPAAVRRSPGDDLPSPVRPAAEKPSASGNARPSDDIDFGDLDLPSPRAPEAEPAVGASKTHAYGDLDLPSPVTSRGDLPAVRTTRDAGADLPVAAAARGVADLPKAKAPAPRAPAPPPPPDRGGALDLDSLDDLPSPAAPHAALPAVMTTNDLDDPFATRPLPKPVSTATTRADLPSAKAAAIARGPTLPAADLPAPRTPPRSRDADLPAVSGAGADLPSPLGAVDLPSPVASGADLPAPVTTAADLPSPVTTGADLPARVTDSAAGRTIGRVTLQRRALPVDEAGLPSVPAALPAVPAALPVAAAALPVAAAPKAPPPARAPAAKPAFGEIDLEMRSPSVPPAPAAPSVPPGKFPSKRPAADAEEFGGLSMRPPSLAPPPASSSGIDDFDFGSKAVPSRSAAAAPSLPPPPDFDLPLPPPPGAASMPPPSMPRAAAPAPSRGVPTPPPQRAARGGTGFGEISLGDEEPIAPPAPVSTGDDEEFGDIPQESAPRRGPSAPVESADSIETAIPPRELANEKPAPTADARRERPAEGTAKVRSRVGLYVGLGLVGAVVIGGAALSMTPAGPFGTTWIDEQLHGAERHAAAAHAVDSVRTALDQDTYAGVRRALRALDTQIQRTPTEKQLFAYGAYAHYIALARFGNDSSLSSRARTLYDRLATLPPGTQYVSAARLARDLVQGRLDGVRRASDSDPLTRDVRTMAMLDGDDAAAALETAQRANERGHTVRTRFLFARALYLADDRAGAIREAEAILESSREHAGARLLLARLLGDRAETRERAVSLAAEVEAMAANASTDERTEAAVMTGEVEFARDRVSQARQAYQRALELDPRSPQALNGIATILYRESNFTEALARFQAAHSADTADLDAQIGIAMSSLALNQPADARSTLEPLVPTHPNDPRVHFWLAKTLLAVNEQTAAEREFREAIRLDNANLEAYTTLASMLFAMQRPDAAEAVLQEARTHVSDQASIHRALGEGRAARGDLAGSLGEFQAAVQARPDDVRSHFLYAQTLRRLGRFDEAAQQLDAVAHIDAEYPGLLIERGQLAEGRGDAAGALTTFRAALSHDPTNAQLIVRVIAALNATGQFAEAESHARQLLAEHGTIAEAHFVRGRALLGLGNAEQAVQEFNRAIELDATRADFRAYAAEGNLGLGQYGAALEQASRAIVLDPNYARGYWVRGEVRVRSGAAVQGLVDVQQALRLDSRFAPALATLADADEALGHVPEAITVYRQALSLEPNRGEWHARLGRLLADSGHTGDAVQELNRSVSLGDPINPPPAWLGSAHRQLGDLLVESDRAGARRHFQRFLELTPSTAAGYADVRRALAELGGR